MNQFKIEDFLKDAVAPADISTIKFSELMKLTGADGLMPQGTRFGTKVFLMKGANRLQIGGKDFSAIRIGSKANTIELDTNAPAPFLKTLINENVIYHGENEGRKWLAFSRKGALVPGKVVSAAELMAELQVKNFAELG